MPPQLKNPATPHDEPTVVPLNGSPYTADQLAELNQKAAEAAEAAQKAAEAVEAAQKAEQEATKKQLLREYEQFCEDSQTYLGASRKADISEAEREKYLRWAATSELRAKELGIKLGIVIPDQEADQDQQAALARRKRTHRNLTIVQVVGLFVLLWLTLDLFFFVGQLISAHNATVAEGGQTLRPPYDLTSIQKYLFESFMMFADLPRAALLCLLVLPTIVLYIVPIIKSKKDFWTEFFNDLTPWQRAILSVITVLGFLLLSVLAHIAKP